MTDNKIIRFPLPADLALTEAPFDPDSLELLEADSLDEQQSVELERITGWLPETNAHAEWLLRVASGIGLQRQGVAEEAAAWRERINEWEYEQSRTLNLRYAFLETALIRYGIMRRMESDDAIKSIDLPSGSVRTRSYKATVGVEDEAAVLDWIDANIAKKPGLDKIINVKRSVLVSALRDYVKPREVIEVATVQFTCGERIVWDHGVWRLGGDEDTAGLLPRLGDGVLCPSCGSEVLTGDIISQESRWVAMDDSGNVVPGCIVEPPTVSASVSVDGIKKGKK